MLQEDWLFRTQDTKRERDMNNFILNNRWILLAIMSLVVLGCEQYVFEDDIAPNSAFSLSKTQVSALEVVELTNEGNGEFYTIFTGVNGSRYDFRDQGESGIPGNERGDASFSYDTAGVFKVTYVVTTYDSDGALIEDVSFQNVTVSDTVNSINKISFSFDGFIQRGGNLESSIYVVESLPDVNNNIIVPVFNYSQLGYNSVASVPVIPDVDINSTAVEISIGNLTSFVNGETVVPHFNFESRYRPVTYNITSQTNVSNDYLVGVVEIPEFASFNTGGASSINIIHPFLDDVFFSALPVELGADMSSLTPNFELYYPNETTVSFNGQVVSSGVDSYDFSVMNEFNLNFEQEGYEDIFHLATSTFIRGVTIPEFLNFSVNGIDGTITLQSDGNPREYHIDISIPEEETGLNIPDTTTIARRNIIAGYLSSLAPEFSTTEVDATTSVISDGEQTSGVTANDFSAYFREFDANPGSFDLDDLRKTFEVKNFYDHVTDSLTYEKAFSVETIYKVAVIVE